MKTKLPLEQRCALFRDYLIKRIAGCDQLAKDLGDPQFRIASVKADLNSCLFTFDELIGKGVSGEPVTSGR